MELTHFDENGKALMADVSVRNDTECAATAAGRITVSQAVYDMCRAIDKSMEIGEIYLCRKTGGKSGGSAEYEESSEACKVTGRFGYIVKGKWKNLIIEEGYK